MSDKNGNDKPDVAALRAEIAQTRSDLGETVQALANKADVKARAKEQVEATKAKVRTQASEAGTKVAAAAHVAGDKVREVAHLAGDRAKTTADQVANSASEAPDRVRANPVPLAAVVIGIVAAVGVILIVRGRRR